MPIISGSGGGGNTTAQVVASGKVLPVADATGVTVDTTTYADTIKGGGAKLTTLVFPANQGALAIAQSGDAFPRWLFASDAADGVYGGDGTFDPHDSGGEIAFTSGISLYGEGASLLNAVVDANIGPVTAVGALEVGNGGFLQANAGAPTVGGRVGSLYIRTDGGVLTTIYRCTVAGTAGNATWVGIV